MKIAVFDSGKGGAWVADHIRCAMPDVEVYAYNDVAHLPYGGRSTHEVRTLTERALTPILNDPTFDTIVIACNTATAANIRYLRQTYPHVTWIGVEPMIKPASAHSVSGAMIVCATPGTLQSKSYVTLKEQYCTDVIVYEPDCSSWAQAIEYGILNENDVRTALNKYVDLEADSIVLGCTHYHIVKDMIERLYPNVRVFEPTDAIIRRIATYTSARTAA